jgi:hypothetical protein
MNKRRLSNLFRNVSFSFDLPVVVGVSARAKPYAAVWAARLGRSGGGHPSECWLLRSIQPLQLHSLLIALPPGMFLRRFTPYLLNRLARRDLYRSGSLDQIFIVHDGGSSALHTEARKCIRKRLG